MNRARGFAGNGTPYRGVYFGVPDIARRIINALNAMNTQPLTSRTAGIRQGDQGNAWAWSYRGECGPLQSFRGAAGFVGATAAGIRPGFNTVLPGTTALPADVHDQLPGNPG